MIINYNQLDEVSQRLASLIEINKDSCAIYNLGNSEKDKTNRLGYTENAAIAIKEYGYINNLG